MNMDNNPTTDDLRDLLAQCSPDSMHGVWVEYSGEVRIAPIETSAARYYESNKSTIKFMFDAHGADYVGPDPRCQGSCRKSEGPSSRVPAEAKPR